MAPKANKVQINKKPIHNYMEEQNNKKTKLISKKVPQLCLPKPKTQ